MKDNPESISVPSHEEQLVGGQIFQSVYGASMMEWSQLEGILSIWFAVTAGLKENMAREIFYSAASFRPRIDMIYAAIKHTDLPDDYIPFLKALLSKSKKYAATRNKLAHGEIHFNLVEGTATYAKHVLTNAGPTTLEELNKGLTIEKLAIANKNFKALRILAVEMLPACRLQNPEIQPEEHRLSIHRLPSEACCDEPNRNHLPQSPPAPSRLM